MPDELTLRDCKYSIAKGKGLSISKCALLRSLSFNRERAYRSEAIAGGAAGWVGDEEGGFYEGAGVFVGFR